MKGRPRVVQLSSLPVIPPITGGELRAYHLGTRLARRCEWTLVCAAPLTHDVPAGLPFLRESRNLLSVRFFPFAPEVLAAERPLRQAHTALSSWTERLLGVIEEVRAEVLVLEHVWNIETLSAVRTRFPDIVCILDAHNVESTNLYRYGVLHPERAQEIEEARSRVLALESSLSSRVEQAWACSERDARALHELNGDALDIAVVPNGVDPKLFTFARTGEDPVVVFTGALHYPLVHESLLRFLEWVWPRVRAKRADARLVLAGRDPLPELTSAALRHGGVEVIENPPSIAKLIRRASVAIVPLISGSGTRIKILEAMASGVPVVSTSIGAEGLEVSHERDILIADGDEEQADAITRLFDDPGLRDRLGRSGRSLVEDRYDWDLSAERAFSALSRLLEKG